MEKRDAKTLVFSQEMSLGLYIIGQEGKVPKCVSCSLKGDMHLLENCVPFSLSAFEGWIGSYYFSIAAHDSWSLNLLPFQEGDALRFFCGLSDAATVFNSSQHSS